jgi:hypothetical protein
MMRGSHMASSTGDHGPRMGSSTPGLMGPGVHGVPGVVSSIGTDSFTMTGRGLGTDAATTTLTVVVTSSTKFFKIGMGREPRMLQGGMPQRVEENASSTGSTTPPVMASTTASFADLTVGAKVEVLGKIATSTKTITADRVMIGNDNGPMGRGGDHMGSSTGSTTDTHGKQGGFGGFLTKLKNLFGGHGGDQNTTGGPAAASEGGDVISNILHFFGF